MTDFKLATTKTHFNAIAKLANIVWHEHYLPIIGKAQVEYMVAKFQTCQAMQQQANEGYEYYIITYKSENVGYLSVKKNNNDLFLSKIYLFFNKKSLGVCLNLYPTVN